MGEQGPDEQFLRDIVQKMFMDLDTPEKKDTLIKYITGLQQHILSLD